ncbi:MAG: helix-turn-helix transcriptional regulator [Phycisphaerales bacterium]|nr:MAG: helix-turn-helix transcriptional regulator [Phycisphaerales bacterium]
MNEFEKLIADRENRIDLCVEITTTRIAELLAKQLSDRRMTRAEFARLLDVTPGRVTQMLDGDSNLQIRTIAKALAVLDLVIEAHAVTISSLSCPDKWEDATPNMIGIQLGVVPRQESGASQTSEPNKMSYSLAA